MLLAGPYRDRPVAVGAHRLAHQFGGVVQVRELVRHVFLGEVDRPCVHAQQGAGFDLAAERAELIAKDTRYDLPARAGVEELVLTASDAGLRLGVASSSSRDRVEGHLSRLGLLNAFDAVRCRSDDLRTKPAPDIFLAALEDIGSSASEAVAFEDSPNGTQAAKAAGIYTVAVPNDVTRGWEFDHADRVIDSLAGVTSRRCAAGCARNGRATTSRARRR